LTQGDVIMVDDAAQVTASIQAFERWERGAPRWSPPTARSPRPVQAGGGDGRRL
jgi:hypothetical protein